MKKKIANISILLLLSLVVFSCQDTKNIIQGKKRSESSDEFLVKKKNPLMTPPDIDQLPVPIGQEIENTANVNTNSLKEILEANQSQTSNQTSENQSLESSIIEKISD